MSREVDERVVEMQFDNTQFERKTKQSLNTIEKLKAALRFDDAGEAFEGVAEAAENLGLDEVSDEVGEISLRFKALDVVAGTVISNITTKVVNLGTALAKALTIDPVKSGFEEYETQINAVQTILANTQSKGTTLEEVNAALDELNYYADMTIYNFTEMTRNIGTFTAAGVDLDTSVQAIKGIANLAAVSGSTSQQASTAMYQLSQALAAGTVKLQDWNSVVNAGMGGQVFQDALKETARVHGIEIDEMIEKEGSFRDTLSDGWLTASILTETLAKFTGDLTEEELEAIGYTEEQIEAIMEMGETANDAATKVKTFTQLIDTLKEATQSGWTQSWEYIIGDFEEAKELWTEISDRLSEIINKSSDARNALLKSGLASGWKQFLGEGLDDSTDIFTTIMEKIGKEYGGLTDEAIEEAGGITNTFEQGWLTADLLSGGIQEVLYQLQNLESKSDSDLEALGISRSDIHELQESYGTLFAEIQNGTLDVEEFVEKINRPSGRENLFQSLLNVMDGLGSAISPIKTAFDEIFSISGDTIYNITTAIRSFTEQLTISDETADKISRTFKGFFSLFKTGYNLIKRFVRLIKSSLSPVLSKLGSVVEPVVSNILDFTASIGDFLTNLSDLTGNFDISLTDIFGGSESVLATASSGISGLTNIISTFKDALSGKFNINLDSIIDNLKNFTISDRLTNAFNKLKELSSSGTASAFSILGAAISAAFTLISDVFTGFVKLLPTVIAGIAMLPTIAGSAFTKFADGVVSGVQQIKEGIAALSDPLSLVTDTIKQKFNEFGGLDIYRILSLIDVGALALMINQLAKAIKNASSGITSLLKDPLTKALNSISGAFDAIKSAVTTWKKAQTYKNLQAIAVALIGFAAALYILAQIDMTHLAAGVVTIIVIMKTLTLSIKSLSKTLNKLSFGKLAGVGVMMLGIAAGITVLSKGISTLAKTLFSYNYDVLEAKIVAFGAVIIGLVTFMVGLGQLGSMVSGTSAGTMLMLSTVILSLTVALKAMSKAALELSTLDIPGLLTGLGSVIILLESVMYIVNGTNFTGLGAGSGLAILSMAGALAIMSVVVKQLAALDFTAAILAVEEVAVLMIGMSIAAEGMRGVKFTSGAAMVTMAASLLVLYKSIEKYSKMDFDTFIKGIAYVATGLAVLVVNAVALSRASKDVLTASAALIVMGASLTIVAGVIEQLAAMDFWSVVQALVAFVVVLGGMTASLAVLSTFSAGLGAASKAVLGIGVAMIAMSAALRILGGLNFGQIVSGLVGIVAMLGVMIGAGAIVSALPTVAAGLVALATALSGLAKVFMSFAAAALGLTVAAAALSILAFFAGPICQAIIGAAPDIGEALTVLITTLCSVIQATIAPILDTIGVVVIAVVERLLVLIEAAIPVIKEGITYLAENIKDWLYTTFYDHDYFGFSFLNPKSWVEGIKGAIDEFIGYTELLNQIQYEQDGFVYEPNQQAYEQAGYYVAQGVADGIENGTPIVKEKASEIGSAADDAIRESMQIESPSRVAMQDGQYVAEGYALGIQNGIPNVSSAMTILSESARNVFLDYWQIHSPSETAAEDGKNIDAGVAQGIEENTSLVDSGVESLASRIQSGLIDSGLLDFSYGFGYSITQRIAEGMAMSDLGKEWQDAQNNPLIDKDSIKAEAQSILGVGGNSGISGVTTSARKSLAEFKEKLTDAVTDVSSGLLTDDTTVQDALAKLVDEVTSPTSSSSSSSSSSKTVAEQIEEKYEEQLEANKTLREILDAEYELWLTENQNGVSSEELIAKQLEYTTAAIENQTSRLEIAQQKYDEMLAALGDEDQDTREAYLELLEEKQSLSELRAEQYVDMYEDAIERLETEQNITDKQYELWTDQNLGASDVEKTNKKIENITSQLANSAEKLTYAEKQYQELLEAYSEADLRTMQAKSDWLDAQIEYQEKQNELWEAQLEEFDNAITAIERAATTYSSRTSVLSTIFDDGDLSSRADDYISAVQTYGVNSEEALKAKYQGSASGVYNVATALRSMSDELKKATVYQDIYNELLESGTATADELAAAEQNLLSSQNSFVTYAAALAEAFNLEDEGQAIMVRLAYVISDNWSTIYSAFSNVWSKLEDKFPALTSGLENVVSSLLSEDAATIATGLVSTITSALTGDYGGAVASGLVTVIEFMGSDLGQTLVNSFSNVLSGGLSNALSSIASSIGSSGLLSTIGSAVSGGLSGIVSSVSSAVGSSGILSSLGTAISGVVTAIGEGTGLAGVLGSLGTAFSGILALLPELIPVIAIAAAVIGVMALLTNCWDDISEFFNNLWENFKEIGSNILEAFVEGIRSVVSGVTSFVSNLFSGIVNTVKSIFGINSPSRVFMELGEYVDEGFSNGIAAGADGVTQAISDMSAAMLAAAEETTSDVYNALTDSTSLAPSITPVVDLTDAEDSSNWLRSSLAGIDNTVQLDADRSARLAIETDRKRNQNGKSESDSTRSDVVAAIDYLSERVAMMGENMGNLQVVMDSGKLVGSISGKMDAALGKRATRARRGG